MAIAKKDLSNVKKGSLISIRHFPYNGFGNIENTYTVTSIVKKGYGKTFYLKKVNGTSRADIKTHEKYSEAYFAIRNTAVPAKILKVINK
jgi:hypothetical protein